MDIKTYTQGYHQLSMQVIDLQEQLAQKRRELRETQLSKDIEELERLLQYQNGLIRENEEVIKDLMIQNWVEHIKKDWWELKISWTPWTLEIKDESAIPNKYKKEKILSSIDKAGLKKDILAGVIELPNVSICKQSKITIKPVNK